MESFLARAVRQPARDTSQRNGWTSQPSRRLVSQAFGAEPAAWGGEFVLRVDQQQFA